MEANVVDHSSMWSLVSNASIVVQLVMLTLVAASVTSWIMIFQRSNLLRAGRRALESFEERFWSGIDLSKLYRQAGSNRTRIPASSRSSVPASRNSPVCASSQALIRKRSWKAWPVPCALPSPAKKRSSSRACRSSPPSVPSARTSVCSVPSGAS